MGSMVGEITYEHWANKIYDDVHNPLQLIREVVQAQNLDMDDILFQMKLKIWDEPLEYIKFTSCIRRLDPSFSDSQTKSLFDKLKGPDGLLNI